MTANSHGVKPLRKLDPESADDGDTFISQYESADGRWLFFCDASSGNCTATGRGRKRHPEWVVFDNVDDRAIVASLGSLPEAAAWATQQAREGRGRPNYARRIAALTTLRIGNTEPLDGAHTHDHHLMMAHDQVAWDDEREFIRYHHYADGACLALLGTDEGRRHRLQHGRHSAYPRTPYPPASVVAGRVENAKRELLALHAAGEPMTEFGQRVVNVLLRDGAETPLVAVCPPRR